MSGALVTISWLLLLGRMTWWQRVIAGTVGACAGLIVIGIADARYGTVEAALRYPADAHVQGLATHLAQSDAHFYGAAGCSSLLAAKDVVWRRREVTALY